MVRKLGPVALAAAAALTVTACATTAPPSKPIIPTMNTPVPETETMYAALEQPEAG
jgi:hypothetical protein